MLTIADAVRSMVVETPFLEEALAAGLINHSALARTLRPRVEEQLVKPVSEAALVMALRRLAVKVQPLAIAAGGPMEQVRDLTVRSGLVERTYLRSNSLVAAQQKLLQEIQHGTHRFVTFTQGVFEVTLILDAELDPLAERLFGRESLLAHLDDLAGVTIRLSQDSVETPGVHYAILKQLAFREINVVEVVSTYTELTVVLRSADVGLAFQVLMGSKESGAKLAR